MSRHEGRIAIVTGAASGIGLAIAKRLHADGAKLVLADRDEKKVMAAAQSLGSTAHGFAADVSDESAVISVFDQAEKLFGPADLVVNNAGIIRIESVAETALADWRKLMAINLDGVFLGSREAARRMIASGKPGSIINAASGAAKRGVGLISSYCASKAAVMVFSQALALELAAHRIRVNCYAPGHIETPFWEGIAGGFAAKTGQKPAEVIETFRASVPWGRFGTPDEVAAAVSWLASSEAEYISGQTIAMNGAEFTG
jgi:NAD(P)-dependent dehydrogenase (short-subunit alcohol dehydrogenase family)